MKLLILICLVASVLATPSDRTKKDILPGDARYDADQHQIHGTQKPKENESEISDALKGATASGSADLLSKSRKPDEQVRPNPKVTNAEAKPEDAASKTTYGQSRAASFNGVAQNQGAKFVHPEAGVRQTSSFGFLQPQQPYFAGFSQNRQAKNVQAEVASPGVSGVTQKPLTGFFQPQSSFFTAQNQGAKYVQPQLTPFGTVAPSPFSTYLQPHPTILPSAAHSHEVESVQAKAVSPFDYAHNGFYQSQNPYYNGFTHGGKYVQPQLTPFGTVAQNPYGAYIQPQYPYYNGFAQNQGNKWAQPHLTPFGTVAQNPFGTYPAAFADVAQNPEPVKPQAESSKQEELVADDRKDDNKPQGKLSAFNAASPFAKRYDSSVGTAVNSRFSTQFGTTFPATAGYGYNPGLAGYKGINSQYYNNNPYYRPGYDQFSGRPFGFEPYPGQYNPATGKLTDPRFPPLYSADYNKNFPYGQHPFGYTTPRPFASFSTFQPTRVFGDEPSKGQEQTVKSPESSVQPTAASYQQSASLKA